MNEEINSGLYASYKFNSFDSRIRKKLGLYCEELFPKKKFASVLKKISEEEPKLLEKLVILPAMLVVTSKIEKGTYALYMPIERIKGREKEAQDNSNYSQIERARGEAGKRSNSGHPFS